MVIVLYIILLILKRKILLLESQDQEVVSASKSKLKLNLMIDDDRRIIGELSGISSLQRQCKFFWKCILLRVESYNEQERAESLFYYHSMEPVTLNVNSIMFA